MVKNSTTEPGPVKETARFNYKLPEQKAEEIIRYKEVRARFTEEANLKAFPFDAFPLKQRKQYAESLKDLRVLTFANKNLYDIDNLNALYPHPPNETELRLFQMAEAIWLDHGYKFQDSVAYDCDIVSESKILKRGHDIASFSDSSYEQLEQFITNTTSQKIIHKNRPDYLILYALFAYIVVDAILAKVLVLPSVPTMFFSEFEKYLKDKKTRLAPQEDHIPSISLEEGIRFYKEYLKWKYKIAEDRDVSTITKKLCDTLPTVFISANLAEPCKTENQSLKLAQQIWATTDLTPFGIKGHSIKRTTISHIRSLLTQLSAEKLAAFDARKPITWLSLAFLIESRQKLHLQRYTKRKGNDNRNGSQEYSVSSYIKQWIDLAKKSPKSKDPAPQFSYNKIHRYIMQFVVYADMRCRGMDELYSENRKVCLQAVELLEQVFLHYNYESAVAAISQFIQDIHKFYWAFLNDHFTMEHQSPS